MTTYTTPRYPVHLIDFVTATNGRRVTIRPMLPQDFQLQREFFHSLSARARYCRFMTSFNELPDGVAERLGKIDYQSHLALLAEVFEDRSETGWRGEIRRRRTRFDRVRIRHRRCR